MRHEALAASRLPAFAAFDPSIEMADQFEYPAGPNLLIFSSTSPNFAVSPDATAGLAFAFIHAWSGQSGWGLVPHCTGPGAALAEAWALGFAPAECAGAAEMAAAAEAEGAVAVDGAAEGAVAVEAELALALTPTLALAEAVDVACTGGVASSFLSQAARPVTLTKLARRRTESGWTTTRARRIMAWTVERKPSIKKAEVSVFHGNSELRSDDRPRARPSSSGVDATSALVADGAPNGPPGVAVRAVIARGRSPRIAKRSGSVLPLSGSVLPLDELGDLREIEQGRKAIERAPYSFATGSSEKIEKTPSLNIDTCARLQISVCVRQKV